mgnify:CR=1 FL=1
MNKTLQPNTIDTTPENPPAPKGIGMAVAFDWGITVQLLLAPFLPLFLGNPPYLKQMNVKPTTAMIISILISWPIALAFAIFGEGIRRGWRWTRPLQILGNTLGFLGGFAVLWNLWNSSKHGNYWPIVPTVILLIISPLIAYRLSRPATAKWFATVKSDEARKRHSGFWLVSIISWSIVGGVLQAIASFIR